MKISGAATIIVAAVLVTSGCFANPIESLVEDAVSETVEKAVEAETGVDVELGDSAELPADWPVMAAIPDGVLLLAYAEEGAWGATFSVADTQAAEAPIQALQSGGFAIESEQTAAGVNVYVLTDGRWDVSYSWVGDPPEQVIVIINPHVD